MAHPVVADLRIPVVAAPMFLVSGPDLVIAACRAGIVGSFPTQNARTAADLDEWMGTITDATQSDGSAPWAANLVTHSTNTRLADDLKLIAEYRPPVVITALGSPRPAIETVHAYGGIVIADVVNLSLAHKAAATGVDGMACIAAGAGGHTGYLSPFAFISAVRKMFDGLVIVGGGIADGHGVAGAVVAGADLVYVGTRFLATRESMAVDDYKRMVVEHGPDDLVISSAITGAPASWLRPSLAANGYDPNHLDAEQTVKNYDAASDSAATRWRDLWAAGQGLGAVDAVQSVADVVDTMAAEYDMSIASVQARLPSAAG
ncbi:nitronate monooxygenase [Gordonia sp. CPCC 205515]|uniref:NAD(P)H-dependent flavin oxidoreductase n=1 Tax=Gordonia sp. CPCC 205515 TaxID=3140791 RepID=UPI003AF3D8B0